MKNYIIIAVIVIFSLAGLYWVGVRETGPKPGQKIAELGRDHVSDSVQVEYNSNPPTSGNHNNDWEKPGIYDQPLNDRKLVHSLEHGYIIISYNCDFQKKNSFKLINSVWAHEENQESSPSADTATESGHLDLTQWKNDLDCKKLVEQFTSVADKKRIRKLIVVPRPNLDNRIALTAWGKLDKFADFDEKRITAFIDAYRGHGPEQTME